jgi:uncharacterized protein (DUF433 family)
MAFPPSPYVDQIDNGDWGIGLRIAGTRVSLSLVVVRFREHQTPKQIVESFPTLSLARVYGAIAYYLENQSMLDDYFAEVEREFERRVPPISAWNPELAERLERGMRERSKIT